MFCNHSHYLDFFDPSLPPSVDLCLFPAPSSCLPASMAASDSGDLASLLRRGLSLFQGLMTPKAFPLLLCICPFNVRGDRDILARYRKIQSVWLDLETDAEGLNTFLLHSIKLRKASLIKPGMKLKNPRSRFKPSS